MKRSTSPTPLLLRQHGFTLMEMLVVISLAVIALAIVVPVIGASTRSDRNELGANTVNLAVTAARTYAMQSKADMDPPIPGAAYSGTGLIFTPGGEIRLVEDNQLYYSFNGTLQALETMGINGFSDIPDRDYIQLPSGVGVVGMTRATSDQVMLLAPPFGVRFNEHGQLVASITTLADMIYYDADYGLYSGGSIITTNVAGFSRDNPFSGTPYNPDTWDHRHSGFTNHNNTSSSPGLHSLTQRYKLPFEQIETVAAVVVFDLNQFRSANLTLTATVTAGVPDPVNDAATTWIMANGKRLFFSRFGANVMQEIPQ